MKAHRFLLPLVLLFGLHLGAQEPGSFFDIEDLAPQVTPFENEEAALKLARDYRVVYFFGASWCDLCRKSLKSFRDRKAEIPPDVRIILVDFDNADDLRIKYAIPLQDVFVQIDARGNRQALWVGGGLDKLKRKIGQKAVREETL